MLFKKPPRVEGSTEDLDEVLKTVTEDKTDLLTFVKHITEEVVTVGRTCVVVDVASDVPSASPYLTSYTAEQVINWKTEIKEDGSRGVSLLVIYETHSEPEDEFSHDTVPQIRVLGLEEGKYYVRLYRERERPDPKNPDGPPIVEWVLEETLYPVVRGQRLTFIPAVIIGVMDTAPDVEKPPLLDVAEVNLSLYRTSADLEHGRHFTALPTAYVAGDVDEDRHSKGLKLGSTSIIKLEAGGTAGFLEFTGQGLSSLEKATTDKKEEMAVLGARILLSDPSFQEASETLRIRKLGEGSIAASIANTVGVGMTQALRWWQMWHQARETLEMNLNTEFVEVALDATLLQNLMAAVMQKQLSWESFFYNVKKSELVPEERTLEEEIELINSGGPNPLDGAEEDPEDDDPEDDPEDDDPEDDPEDDPDNE